MAKVNLDQTGPSHVSESYTSHLYWNAQVNQDMKVLSVWFKNEVISKNWISKLELKFSERVKNMNSLENKLH